MWKWVSERDSFYLFIQYKGYKAVKVTAVSCRAAIHDQWKGEVGRQFSCMCVLAIFLSVSSLVRWLGHRGAAPEADVKI